MTRVKQRPAVILLDEHNIVQNFLPEHKSLLLNDSFCCLVKFSPGDTLELVPSERKINRL